MRAVISQRIGVAPLAPTTLLLLLLMIAGLLTSKFPTYTLRVPIPAAQSAVPPSLTPLSAKKLPAEEIGVREVHTE